MIFRLNLYVKGENRGIDPELLKQRLQESLDEFVISHDFEQGLAIKALIEKKKFLLKFKPITQDEVLETIRSTK